MSRSAPIGVSVDAPENEQEAAFLEGPVMIENISAVTLATKDMRRAVQFYRMLGLELIHGGEDAGFTSFRVGANFLNLISQPAEMRQPLWGRVIFYESNVDALYARLVA